MINPENLARAPIRLTYERRRPKESSSGSGDQISNEDQGVDERRDRSTCRTGCGAMIRLHRTDDDGCALVGEEVLVRLEMRMACGADRRMHSPRPQEQEESSRRNKRQREDAPTQAAPRQTRSCSFVGRTVDMLYHLCAEHGWPVTLINTGGAAVIRVGLSETRRILLASDGSVFILANTRIATASALSLSCIMSASAGGHRAAYKYQIWCGSLPTAENAGTGRGIVYASGPAPFGGVFDPAPPGPNKIHLIVPPALKLPSGDMIVTVCIDKLGI
ncbi:hypothetical protein EJB05_31545, partial [Eragrostis curvula]